MIPRLERNRSRGESSDWLSHFKADVMILKLTLMIVMRESLGPGEESWRMVNGKYHRVIITTYLIQIPVNKYSYSLSDDMGLYRARLVRFFLGIAVLIAIVQILTTLHFSSIHGNEASLFQGGERTKRSQLESTTSPVDHGQRKTAANGKPKEREAEKRVPRNRVSRRIYRRFLLVRGANWFGVNIMIYHKFTPAIKCREKCVGETRNLDQHWPPTGFTVDINGIKTYCRLLAALVSQGCVNYNGNTIVGLLCWL